MIKVPSNVSPSCSRSLRLHTGLNPVKMLARKARIVKWAILLHRNVLNSFSLVFWV